MENALGQDEGADATPGPVQVYDNNALRVRQPDSDSISHQNVAAKCTTVLTIDADTASYLG